MLVNWDLMQCFNDDDDDGICDSLSTTHTQCQERIIIGVLDYRRFFLFCWGIEKEDIIWWNEDRDSV